MPISNVAAISRLRERLDPCHPAIAMASHNPLAAKLAAQAGFDAIWGSGFELSAAYAVPDASILSVDTHLELMRAIGEVQEAPVIADLDTGYGNAVNVAYLVPRYAAAGIAAVVIEDKTFPKDSSLRPERTAGTCSNRGISGQDRGRPYLQWPVGGGAHRSADRRAWPSRGTPARSGLHRGRRGCRADPQ